ncbi:methyltransferase domain-containing protein [Pyrodictium occultum]|uniref:methyltransferase domain-containing protein n=1 Tax=Pyrodictium occultum TaxID=2309 RepID=UPI0009FACEC2|nr:methyltransferase domain-containing protein [Pyrodictium occultum]
MCHVSVLEFFIEYARAEEFKGKKVLEVGSRYVNGSVRPLIEKYFQPKEYIGVDIEPGKFVDLVLPAERLLEYFGPESFDVVISTELLEHVVDWRLVVNNMKGVLKRGGYIYITTRSRSFPYHAYPYDFWRYEIEDMKRIFADFNIIKLEKDHQAPGVFLKAKKPENYVPADLSNIALYSIILGRRTRDIPDIGDAPLIRRLILRLLSSKAKWLLPGGLLRLIEKKIVV